MIDAAKMVGLLRRVPLERRPVVVGMNNPLHPGRPAFDLHPYPRQSAGGCLHALLDARTGLDQTHYRMLLERHNLCSEDWSIAQARTRWRALRGPLAGRRCVALGRAVAHAVGLEAPAPLRWTRHADGDWAYLPHTSGRNRWYNEEGHRLAAEVFMEELYLWAITGL